MVDSMVASRRPCWLILRSLKNRDNEMIRFDLAYPSIRLYGKIKGIRLLHVQ